MLIRSRETSQSFQDYAHRTARATVRDTEKIHLGAVPLERGSSNALERERERQWYFIYYLLMQIPQDLSVLTSLSLLSHLMQCSPLFHCFYFLSLGEL